MTSKEAVIKLFEDNLGFHAISLYIQHGWYFSGFYYTKDTQKYFVGICEDRLVFSNLIFDLSPDESARLKVILENRKEELRQTNLKKLESKKLRDLMALEEIASENNYDKSRRVLTEKRRNNTEFKI